MMYSKQPVGPTVLAACGHPVRAAVSMQYKLKGRGMQMAHRGNAFLGAMAV